MKKANGKALLPLVIFILAYVGLSIVAGDMYGVSVIIPFSIAAISALVMNRRKSLNEKIDIFCKGAGDSNVILMIIILPITSEIPVANAHPIPPYILARGILAIIFKKAIII